jgi:probable HAF family extracellular repeat protein
MNIRKLFAGLSAAMLLQNGIPTSGAPGPITYTVTDLGALSANLATDTDSSATAINSAGYVVGYSGVFDNSSGTFLSHHAFAWIPKAQNAPTGAIADLRGLPGFVCVDVGHGNNLVRFDTNAWDINDLNQISGDSWTGDGTCQTLQLHAAIYGGSSPKDLGVPTGTVSSSGSGINSIGDVVGHAENQPGTSLFAFFYDGTFHDLGALPNFPFGEANKVNAAGQVVGQSYTADLSNLHAFLHKGTGPITAADDLGTLGGTNSAAYGINANGVVVGNASLADNSVHGFIYIGGKMSDLGTLTPGVFNFTGASAINNSNDVVGVSQTAAGDNHAVIWKKGGPIADLNTMINPASGWTLTSATGINDSGQIVGQGMLNGHIRAFLLTPPETGLEGLILSAATVCGTVQTTIGTVTLQTPAGASGALVPITSSRPNVADGPPSVTVAAGQTKATFPITTRDVSVATPVTITAFLNGTFKSATLTVHPLLSSVSFTPREICSRTTATAKVTLACPAPVAESVSLSSADSGAAPVPNNVEVSLGKTIGSFSVTGGDVFSDANDIAITATLGADKQSDTLTVHPLLGNLTIVPATVMGKKTAIGTVSLTFNIFNGQNCQAPHGGINVALVSDNSEVARPAVPSITIPGGSSIGTFTINTSVPTAQTCAKGISNVGTCAVDISAEAAGGVQTASVDVTQPGSPAAVNVSQIVSVIPGGFHFDHATNTYTQELLIVNQVNSQTPIAAPIGLVLDHFPPGDTNPDPWVLIGAKDLDTSKALVIGTTKATTPVNRPVVTLSLTNLPTPGVLNPGDSVTILLNFSNPTNAPITYIPVMIAGGKF